MVDKSNLEELSVPESSRTLVAPPSFVIKRMDIDGNPVITRCHPLPVSPPYEPNSPIESGIESPRMFVEHPSFVIKRVGIDGTLFTTRCYPLPVSPSYELDSPTESREARTETIYERLRNYIHNMFVPKRDSWFD